MVIDNMFEIYKLLVFNNETFYKVKIIQRKKDGFPKTIKVGEFNIKTLKDYCYIKELYDKFPGSRFYINVNQRNYKETCLNMIEHCTKMLSSNSYGDIEKVYSKASSKSRKKCFWILDLDNSERIDELKHFIDKTHDLGVKPCKLSKSKIIHVKNILRTVNGWHLIVYPFNDTSIKSHFGKDLEVLKDSNTLMYYNKN